MKSTFSNGTSKVLPSAYYNNMLIRSVGKKLGCKDLISILCVCVCRHTEEARLADVIANGPGHDDVRQGGL